jgi:hypothetical protein
LAEKAAGKSKGKESLAQILKSQKKKRARARSLWHKFSKVLCVVFLMCS